MKYFKPAIYIFLAIFLIAFFYISFQTQKDLDNSTQSETSSKDNSYAGVIVVPIDNSDQTYGGVIKETREAEYLYSLNTKDDKVLLYLKSVNQDLALLTGLEADIKGDITDRFNGVAVMEVKSIKLK